MAFRIFRFLANRALEIVVVLLVFTGLFLLTFPVCSSVREAARNAKTMKKLQEVGRAIYQFDEQTGELPTNTFASDGRALLSWRVHILPQLGERDLYHEFKLDEPWDSPHNIQLLHRIPEAYVHPEPSKTSIGLTHFRGFSNPGALFEKRPPRNLAMTLWGGALIESRQCHRLANLADPLEDTILVVEALEPIEWTRPVDLDASPGKPLPQLVVSRWKNSIALMADGSTRVIPQNIAENDLRALITYNGGEKVTPKIP